MSIEVMKQWLECVERCDAIDGMYSWSDVVDSLRKAIEQAEQEQQEPVAEIVSDAVGYLSTQWNEDWIPNHGDKLFLRPPPRQPLTEYEINCIKVSVPEDDGVVGFARAVEAAHGIGKTK